VNSELKLVCREKRRSRDCTTRLAVQLEAITAAAEAGLKDHDRWVTAPTRKLDGRRSTSLLPALLDYVLTRPIAPPRPGPGRRAWIARATGRGRYRGSLDDRGQTDICVV
jgi:hypothetical protein